MYQNAKYSYEVNDCDVVDTKKLEAFRTEHTKWLNWFSEDEHHSICNQIHEIMWNDATYRSINEARRHSSPTKRTSSLNGMLGNFLDRGFFATQILDISKITDPFYGRKEKGIISLSRFIDDLKTNRHLITREIYVGFDGLPYNYEKVQEEEYASLTKKELREPRWLSRTGPKAWATSEMVHTTFDYLSCTSSENRSREDTISEDVFRTLEGWLNSPILKKIRTLRDKYTAHAADSISRNLKPLDRLGLSLDEFSKAQQIVIRTANEIGATILYHHGVGSPVPTPQFDVFENLDLPFVPNENLCDLHQWWNNYEAERELWVRETINLHKNSIEPYRLR